MRICLVTPELPPYAYGGVGRYVLTLARELGGHGHDVTVVGFRIHKERRLRHHWGTSVSLAGILDEAPRAVAAARQRTERVFNFAERTVFTQKVPYFWRLSHAWSLRHIADGAIALRRFLLATDGQFDVIEVPNYPGYGAFLPAQSTPYVVRLSTPAADGGSLGNVFIARFERRTCERANCVMAHSEAMRTKASVAYRLKPSAVSVVHLGVEDVHVKGTRSASGELVLACCGRAERRKGTDILIRALSVILPAYPSLRVRFIGADVDRYATTDPALAKTWSALKEHCGEQIEQLGCVDDPTRDQFLAGADWTVIPSRFESFGLVAVESMRVGTPVIAARVGGLAEVCGLSPHNILHDPESLSALQEALCRVCDAGGAPSAAREGVRATYLEHFTASRMAESTLEVYQRAIHDAR